MKNIGILTILCLVLLTQCTRKRVSIAINPMSTIHVTNPKLNNYAYSIDVDRGRNQQGTFLEKWYKLPKGLKGELRKFLQEDFTECLLGPDTFSRGPEEYNSLNTVLIKVDNDKTTYWGISQSDNDNEKIALRQLIFKKLSSKKIDYRNIGCYISHKKTNLFVNLLKFKSKTIINKSIPDSSGKFEVIYKKPKIVHYFNITAVLLSFLGGYISAMIIISIFSKSRAWSSKKKNQYSLIYAIILAIFAYIITSL